MKEDMNYKKLCPEGEEVVDKLVKEAVEKATTSVNNLVYYAGLFVVLVALAIYAASKYG